MMMPNRKEIIAKATEIYYSDMAKSGIQNFNTPEDAELLEGGYIASAKSELLHNLKTRNAEWVNTVSEDSDFTIDVQQLFDSNALILGSRHCGKSDTAMLICDLAMQKNAIVIVFDPSQDWNARSGVPRVMKVELYSNLDVPSESTIFDISTLSPIQQQRIVENFSEKLFQTQATSENRKQYLIVFEEAHTYFSQGCMRSENLANCVRLLSVGRNVSIGCVLISQFASMLDKFAVKHALSQAWFGFTREPNDIKYLKQILGSDAEKLSKLSDGEFLYLTRDGTRKIQIEPYENFAEKQQIVILKVTIPPIAASMHSDASEVLRVLMFLGLFIFIVSILGNLR